MKNLGMKCKYCKVAKCNLTITDANIAWLAKKTNQEFGKFM
jgi:hypothetical protein